MAIKGDKQKELVFVRKIGFGLFKALAINPESNEEIKKLGFYVKDTEKDPVYVDKSKEGNERVRLEYYMEEVNTGYKWTETFFLENIPSLSKENGDEPRKKEFINITGQTYWCLGEAELPEKFKESGDYHQAIKGESLLLDFLKKLYNLEWKAEISYNMKKFFNGNFKELRDDMGSAENIIIPLTIKVDEDAETNEIKEYQSSFKAYARGAEYKFVNLKGTLGWTEADIEEIKRKDENNKELFKDRKEGRRMDEKAKWINEIDKVVLRMIDDSYGCKNIYRLSKIHDYKEGSDLPTTGKVINASGADY